MSAAAVASGYRTIGDSTTSTSLPTPNTTNINNTSTSSHAVDRMNNLARNIGGAALGARDTVRELIEAPSKEMNVDTDPLDPRLSYTPGDRIQQILANTRPWREFVDPKAFNIPPASEVKLRLAHNLESFFYNYFLLALVVLLFQAGLHPVRALLLTIAVVAAVLLYIVYPEDYTVTENFEITRLGKHLFMGVLLLLVLTVGHVFSLLFLIALTITPIVLVHALLREHSVTSTPPADI